VLDANLRVVSASRSYYRTFRAEPQAAEGVPVTELDEGRWNLPALLERLRLVGAEEVEAEALEEVEVEREIPGGGRRTLLLNARRFEEEGGATPLLLVAIEDVTERKRVRLAEAMISEVSHRTKNNLAIVAGLLQLQADQHGGADEDTHLIREAITRIRAFAALYEQVQVGPGEQIEVVEAVRRIAEIAQGVLAVQDTDIVVEGAPISYPFEVGTNLTVVANELITNALKHGAPDPMGSLRIRIEVGSRDGSLTLSVWNSGNAIAEDLDLEQTSATGLYLVQSVVVDNYGGEFRLEPHRGGTRAEVVIPEGHLLGQREV
jgi:two-component sensor histidine kinase